MEDIEVTTHDGYKGGERPHKILLGGREYLVKNVLDSTRVVHVDAGEKESFEEHFNVELETYGPAHIVYNHDFSKWTLEETKKQKPFSDTFFSKKG